MRVGKKQERIAHVLIFVGGVGCYAEIIFGLK